MWNDSQPTGSLAGLRVIDASRVLGGPYCGQVLADHGADVIKVEPPSGDETRGWGPPFDGDAASYFVGVNRNKRDIAIDVTQPAGQELLSRLLADADVLIENFKIGTLERWGLGSEALRENSRDSCTVASRASVRPARTAASRDTTPRCRRCAGS